ncbi:PTS sugar transporter subunit IIA [Helcococcus kunzii]|uniref:PTS system, fructose subfamily, IIA component n=1 Tax=Helcococcus kunzii ATCC 51366 TaxID=883114 RepID=H3NQ77_9FIRM|nr:PTS sugar transporter subunit IIA [Helcococcus kunzii]EHR32557.1 PTS system, fructose subfamily, IIA component [Helcococcus kunzii ATCC 51366]
MKYIEKDNIIFNLKIEDKENAIKYLANVFNKNGYLNDLSKYIEEVNKREETMSTSIGKGIAIPHGKTNAVNKPGIVVAKLSKPFIWDEVENEEISIIIMFAADEGEGNTHLKMLADVSMKLMDDDFVEKLKTSKNKEELYKLLRGEQ